MRKPTTIEHLYLDFDGFFAAVEEQARPRLRGKAIGVAPFNPLDERGKPIRSMIIAANRKAKSKGVKTGTSLTDARILCPGMELVPQSNGLYERAHRKLILLIDSLIPITGVSSIVDCLASWSHPILRTL